MLNDIQLTPRERAFVTQYFESAFWADYDDNAPIDSLDDDCIREGTIDALCFYSRAAMYLSDDNFTDAAHTFYLVRQGHGVSFEDNADLYANTTDLYSGYVAQKLTRIAASFGAVEYFTKDGHLINQGIERVE